MSPEPSQSLPPLRPALQFPPALLLRAQPVKVVFLDVDGVLTDGGLYFTAEGETTKRFHTLDGHGLKLIQRAGITPVVISGRDSEPLRKRLSALGVTHMRLGTEAKLEAAEELLAELGLTWAEAGAMGDDWPDLPMLRRAALSVAPPGAHPEALAVAHLVTMAAGGAGAVREMCDLLLMAGGHYAALLEEAGE
ncbi:HAD hydrolase family protein [Hydrogenophaga sp. 5NK40-0174]|uniref:KdsC family phosphatase n=1 Tax=Hydrogenophaga sp. 5NK40-0174 TaxID=3127649 RepID=UPI003109D839